jgi:hypothetical protein
MLALARVAGGTLVVKALSRFLLWLVVVVVGRALGTESGRGGFSESDGCWKMRSSRNEGLRCCQRSLVCRVTSLWRCRTRWDLCPSGTELVCWVSRTLLLRLISFVEVNVLQEYVLIAETVLYC